MPRRISTPSSLLLFFFALPLAIVSTACASRGPFKSMAQGPVRIEIKGQAGQEDLTHYYSHSKVHDFEADQVVRERDEIVEFKVKETVRKVDVENGHFTIETTTTAKDGMVDLHDLAFPEKGETIEYIFTRQGEVLKAGEYPRDSVFYVPPIPLPKEDVQVGDTWTMDHAWLGLKNGIPLGIHLVAILKNIQTCGEGQCVDLEISGNAEMVGVSTGKAQFNSSIWGRVLMSVDRGAVVWSEVRSKERMIIPGARTEVLSCMIARLDGAKNWKGLPQFKSSCQPSENVVE